MTANEVRQLLHRHRAAFRASAKTPGPIPPAYLQAAQWRALCVDWNMGDGPLPGVPRDGTYWWQDVPVVVVLPA